MAFSCCYFFFFGSINKITVPRKYSALFSPTYLDYFHRALLFSLPKNIISLKITLFGSVWYTHNADRDVTLSHSCHKRSVSCLPSDCISVSVYALLPLLIVCNHSFCLQCPDTHLTACDFRSPSSPPNKSLAVPCATELALGLIPKGIAVTNEKARLAMPDNLHICTLRCKCLVLSVNGDPH